MSEFVTVARIGDIPEGEGRVFTVDGRQVGVFNLRGKLHAIDDLCPHQGASLSAGHLDEQGEVTCPWHAWRFSVTDGKWCDNPRLGVDVFEVREVDGEVQVRVG
ncbi:Naphthalene 1,2-dioxygenase/salicylate 5-hydroxylase system, ferredoxin component [Pirellulimonas nuda]|uniref:Naphthalene 1,2-dioxygenase/salicylate 5-hydroxylase system, ferredoxin component n=1 Tax=Pirellulimonas nuda TaxID=2528009 RepID=A0A518D7Y6_9BACT|nr:Rieske (2Fe-2S) protein [Pirellulimonas nuda]QDU87579.1 Naphthalene 1,2-dioxygenase/salicylate 5-hydroxylase system, ferredoxin component [Pirellulimonas nuda]